jgi:uncharacterized protein with beta-barrel porin domain
MRTEVPRAENSALSWLQVTTSISGGNDRTDTSAAVQSCELDGFSETGSVAPLKVSSDSEESLRTDLGFRVWHDIHAGQATVRPFMRAAWEHEYLYSTLPVSASLVDVPGSPVTIFGPSLGHDSVLVSAGVSVQWTRSLLTYVRPVMLIATGFLFSFVQAALRPTA